MDDVLGTRKANFIHKKVNARSCISVLMVLMCRMQVLIIAQVILTYSIVWADLGEIICTDLPDNSIIPHPYECNLYFVCENGYVTTKECPNGTWYNPNSQDCGLSYNLCDHSSEVDNSSTSILTTVTPPTWRPTESISTTGAISHSSTNYPVTLPSEDNTTPSMQPTTTSPTTSIPETPPKCPSYDTPIPTFISSKIYCERYYLCYHGQAIQLRCPPEYHWDRSTKKCLLASETTCTIKNQTVNLVCPEAGQHFYPHVDNCSYFYYCENGIKSVQQCDSFYHWDVEEKTCKLMPNAKCIRNVPQRLRYKLYQ